MADLRSDFVFYGDTKKSHNSSGALAKGASTYGGWFGIGLEPKGAGMEPVFSTSGGDAQHGSIWDVRALESRGSRETISNRLFVTRKDLNTYEEVEMSLGLR